MTLGCLWSEYRLLWDLIWVPSVISLTGTIIGQPRGDYSFVNAIEAQHCSPVSVKGSRTISFPRFFSISDWRKMQTHSTKCLVTFASSGVEPTTLAQTRLYTRFVGSVVLVSQPLHTNKRFQHIVVVQSDTPHILRCQYPRVRSYNLVQAFQRGACIILGSCR